jgi:CheY-like chemotaxis protein
MHGGRIEAHSEGEGKGATFVVTIPVSPIRASTSATNKGSYIETEESMELAPAMRGTLKGVRVLIVDDDTDARLLMKRILADSSAEIDDVSSASDALAKLDSFQPHVLISDIGMPGQDGYDLIRQVRAKGYTFQKLPALALTAFARSEDRRRALLAGFQAHVAKPVDARELTAAIAALVGRTGT